MVTGDAEVYDWFSMHVEGCLTNVIDRSRRSTAMVRISLRSALLASVLTASLVPTGLQAQAIGKVGEVGFPVSCSAEAQQQFTRAVALLHSFWYEEAVKAFTGVAETDPSCAMAYWGVAMSHWYPLWYPPSQAALKAGADAVAKAQSIGAKTDRERDYIEAIAVFYRDSDKLDNRTRSVAYEKAMEQVYSRYPDDREAGVFYALALDTTALPTDKTYTNQEKAAKILQRVFAEQPNHPGAAHYLIHSYDSPSLADLGLPAAICYSDIAPAVPHALHMPSHIFTRVGQWQNSIESNRASAEAGQKYAATAFGPGIVWDQTLHAMDYLEYSYLQTGQDTEAKRVLDQLMSYQKATPASLAAAYAVAAIPARYVVERQNWAEAATLSSPPLSLPGDAFPWTAPMITFARALGAAHTGDFAGAQAEIGKLQAARDALLQAKNTYWAGQVDVQARSASAVLAQAQGRKDEALALMRSAADLEDASDKHPVTPGSIVPARELLGDMLLAANQPAEALAEYERSLKSAPNRFHGLAGAATAAERAGDAAKAKLYREKLVRIGATDSKRAELLAAKQFLAEH
jgi:tetratricopeptide (TPR) repeat protein